MRTPPEMTFQCFNTTGILPKKKKTMWFIGVEVEQERSAPPPKKNPGSAPGDCCICTTMQIEWNGYEVCQTSLLLYLWT